MEMQDIVPSVEKVDTDVVSIVEKEEPDVVSSVEKVEADENIFAEPDGGCIPMNQIVPSANVEKLEVDENSTAELENSSQKKQEDGENDGNDKNLDPYAYLKRPEFSSENFKIEIMNLPKFYGGAVRF